MIQPVPITRPNGKPYRPRKIVCGFWDNNDAGYHDGCGVYVLGTHDVEASRQFATECIQYFHDSSMVAGKPQTCWVRDSYDYRGPAWIDDPERGRAAVCWTAVYPEDRCPGCGNPVSDGSHGMSEYGGCV